MRRDRQTQTRSFRAGFHAILIVTNFLNTRWTEQRIIMSVSFNFHGDYYYYYFPFLFLSSLLPSSAQRFSLFTLSFLFFSLLVAYRSLFSFTFHFLHATSVYRLHVLIFKAIFSFFFLLFFYATFLQYIHVLIFAAILILFYLSFFHLFVSAASLKLPPRRQPAKKRGRDPGTKRNKKKKRKVFVYSSPCTDHFYFPLAP